MTERKILATANTPEEMDRILRDHLDERMFSTETIHYDKSMRRLEIGFWIADGRGTLVELPGRWWRRTVYRVPLRKLLLGIDEVEHYEFNDDDMVDGHSVWMVLVLGPAYDIDTKTLSISSIMGTVALTIKVSCLSVTLALESAVTGYMLSTDPNPSDCFPDRKPE